MNWKEQFKESFLGNEKLDLVKPTNFSTIENFIEKEIIEKLIADIPDYEDCLIADSDHLEEEVNLQSVKQQLKERWLK